MNEHYQKKYSRALTNAEVESRTVTILLDPYRICDVYQIGGGAREQIVKKGLRWCDKGQDETQVLKEILSAVNRRLDMIDEDGLFFESISEAKDTIEWCKVHNSSFVDGKEEAPDGWVWVQTLHDAPGLFHLKSKTTGFMVDSFMVYGEQNVKD